MFYSNVSRSEFADSSSIVACRLQIINQQLFWKSEVSLPFQRSTWNSQNHSSFVSFVERCRNSSEDRLNRVKARKWYRPVAPMIAEEALERVFGKQVHSPYMSMAPKVQDAFWDVGLFSIFFSGDFQLMSRHSTPRTHQIELFKSKMVISHNNLNYAAKRKDGCYVCCFFRQPTS